MTDERSIRSRWEGQISQQVKAVEIALRDLSEEHDEFATESRQALENIAREFRDEIAKVRNEMTRMAGTLETTSKTVKDSVEARATDQQSVLDTIREINTAKRISWANLPSVIVGGVTIGVAVGLILLVVPLIVHALGGH